MLHQQLCFGTGSKLHVKYW